MLSVAYFITCNEVIKNDDGNVVELHCTYDPETKGGSAPDGRKVRGTLHWVSADHAVHAEIRLYDRLFMEENPDKGGDFMGKLNPDSLQILPNAKLEPSMDETQESVTYQFERNGYFVKDDGRSSDDKLVFNRAVTLRDTWAKILNQQTKSANRK